MTRILQFFGARLAAVPLALAATMACADEPKPQPGERIEERVIRLLDGETGNVELKVQLVGEEAALDGEHMLDVLINVPTSDYWLGVQIQPVDEGLRTQLKLPEGEGVLAAKVFPDSPAAKAGVQDNDVVLGAGEKSIKEPGDLVKVVDEAKDKPIALKVLRGGQTISINVTPEKRPESMRAGGKLEVKPFHGLLQNKILNVVPAPQFNIKLSEHWIGVECYTASDAMRKQLQLPENQGIVVAEVVGESPAAKAGLQVNDLLLTAGGKSLESAKDLADAVANSNGQAIALKCLRAGKPIDLSVTPDKRPRHDVLFYRDGADGELTISPDIRKFFVMPKDGDKQTFKFNVPMPGLVLPHGHAAELKLPNNLTINISKTGEQPAQITVQRGDEKWSVSEKELDKLPDDIRPHVAAMLGGGGIRRTMMFQRRLAAGEGEGSSDKSIVVEVPRWEEPIDNRMEAGRDRLESIEKQLDRLREEIRALRQTRQRPAPEAKPQVVPPTPQPPSAPAPERTKI